MENDDEDVEWRRVMAESVETDMDRQMELAMKMSVEVYEEERMMEEIMRMAEREENERVSKPLKINEIDSTQEVRMDTTDSELNRVLGGGIVPGSLILLGGEPGIGKSTLLLQISLKLPYKTLYVSGEESQKQIKMRAERINPNSENCPSIVLSIAKSIHNTISLRVGLS